MSPSKSQKRPVRIAGCSGGFTDRSTAITRMAGDPEVDVVMGIFPLFSLCILLKRYRGLAF